MKLLKILLSILIMPYIITIILSFLYNSIFNRKNIDNVHNSSMYFIESNYQILIVLCSIIWSLLIIKIFIS